MLKRAPKMFCIIRADIQSRTLHNGEFGLLDKETLLRKTIAEILDDHRNLKEARDYLKDFAGRDIAGYTPFGFPYGPKDMQYAIDVVSSNPRLSPFRRKK